jgi:carbonic anhydrase/acetyltransferase-like protein (isoleucine patch superfamily)
MIRTYRGAKPRVDKTAFVHPSAELIGRVTVAAEASIWPGAVLRADVDAIRIGRGSNLQDHVIVHCRPGRPTVVGRRVTVGHRAVLHGTRVGDGVLVGMGAVVMEATLGAECMIGAGAVVPPGMRVPPRSLVLGVPAKIVRKLRPDELAHIRAGEREYRTVLRPGHMASKAVER